MAPLSPTSSACKTARRITKNTSIFRLFISVECSGCYELRKLGTCFCLTPSHPVYIVNDTTIYKYINADGCCFRPIFLSILWHPDKLIHGVAFFLVSGSVEIFQIVLKLIDQGSLCRSSLIIADHRRCSKTMIGDELRLRLRSHDAGTF